MCFVSAFLRPWRLRFSLRLLLCAILLIGCAMAAVAWRMRAATIQHDTVTQLQQRHVVPVYRHQQREDELLIDRNVEPPGPSWLREVLGEDFFAHVDTVHVPTFHPIFAGPVPEFDDSLIRLLARLHSLRTLGLDSTPITDEGLIPLRELKDLRTLSLSNTGITDDGLAHLKGFRKLEDLNISETGITGAGLVHLRGLPCLHRLDVNGTQVADGHAEDLGRLTTLRKLNLRHAPISDRGLKYLEPLINLEELDVGGVTQITDAGVPHLCKLKQLKRLNVEVKQVTADGVTRLRQALPACKVAGWGMPP